MLHITETYTNDTGGYTFGDTPWYETFADTPGELFRSLQKEYGRAKNMYADTPDGPVKIGWVFTSRVRYEDANETYLRSVWVEVSSTPPEKRISYENVTNPFLSIGH